MKIALMFGFSMVRNKIVPEGQARLNKTVELFNQGRVKKILISGGRAGKDGVSEAFFYRDSLVRAGIPKKAILTETEGRDTIENLSKSAEILSEIRNVEEVLLISDPLHLKRIDLSLRLAGDRLGWKWDYDLCPSQGGRSGIITRLTELGFYTYTLLDPTWSSSLAEINRRKRDGLVAIISDRELFPRLQKVLSFLKKV